MKIISFDVGMKNLAYCLFQVSDEKDDINYMKNFAIKISSEKGYVDLILFLIDEGADINCALRLNSKYGHLDVVKSLIEKGADVNAKNNILEIRCYEGLSSVFFSDHLLNHTESTMICVDPFLSIEPNDHKDLLLNNQEIFIFTKGSPYPTFIFRF